MDRERDQLWLVAHAYDEAVKDEHDTLIAERDVAIEAARAADPKGKK